jgi:hypothetical protein
MKKLRFILSIAIILLISNNSFGMGLSFGNSGNTNVSLDASNLLTISKLYAPARVANDLDGNIYVTEPLIGEVKIFNRMGSLIYTIKNLGNPTGIAVDENRIYIGESSYGRIAIYNKYSRTLLGYIGKGNGEFKNPKDIAIDPTFSRIYVVDANSINTTLIDPYTGSNVDAILDNDEIKVYNYSGSFLFKFSNENINSKLISGIVIKSDGKILVSDSKNRKIDIFDMSGNYIRSISFDNNEGISLQGITIDNTGNIYVVDSFQGYVRVLDYTGNQLGYIGSTGESNGELSLPIDTTIDKYGRLIVTSSNTAKIELYGINGSTNPTNNPPSSPIPLSPINNSEVNTYIPALTISNSSDPDGDSLTYDFEVYSDSTLTSKVASGSNVPQNSPNTSWTVNTTLSENTFYYWRARAFDGSDYSNWSNISSFYINVVNASPTAPNITTPGNAVLGPDGKITWEVSVDPDALDIVSYILEIDDDNNFMSIDIRETGITTPYITLESLSQYSNLKDNTWYYFRIKAVDNKGGESSWVYGSFYFDRTEISIESKPSGAKIYMDGNYAYLGRYTGKVTPSNIRNVSRGKHVIQLILNGYEPYYTLKDNTYGKDAYIYAVLKRAKIPEFAKAVPLRLKNRKLLKVSNNSKPFVIDWNEDGKKDLLVSDAVGNIHLYINSLKYEIHINDDSLLNLNKDNEEPKLVYKGVLLNVGNYPSIFVVDWNNDGKRDLIVGNEDGVVRLYINNGTNLEPSYGSAVKIAKVSGMASPFVVDWNNDNKKDLVVGDMSGNLNVYINYGSDREPVLSTNPSTIFLGIVDLSLFITDWNMDGRKDLIVGNRKGSVYLFINIGTDSNPQFNSGIRIISNKDKSATPFIVNWDNKSGRDIILGSESGYVYLFKGTVGKDSMLYISHSKDYDNGLKILEK